MQGWKPYPRALLDDPRVKAHHHSIALAVLALTSISHGPATDQQRVRTAAGLTSRAVGRLAWASEGNAGTYLADLERCGHLDLERSGRRITGIAWNEKHLDALCSQEAFIRVPMPILCDYSLPSRLKHTYVALRWAEFRYPRGCEFTIAVTSLADLMHIRSRNTVRERLRELQSLCLIEPGTGRSWNQIRPLRFVPPKVRYARIDGRGKQLFGGLPTHLPLIDHDRRYERFVQDGRRIEELVWALGEEAPPSLQVVEQRYWGPIVSGIDRPADPTEPTWRSATSNLENDRSSFHVDRLSLQVDHSEEVVERTRRNEDVTNPRGARMSNPVEVRSSKPRAAWELTDYLREKLREQHARLGDPDWIPEIKAPAVGKQINSMLDNGVEPKVIQEMIDIFTASQGYHRSPAPPWLMFIEHRSVLLHKARASINDRSADAYDDADWLSFDPLPVDEEADWLDF